MAQSPLTGIESAPVEPPGHDVELLGPSDSSDSGSDSVGSPDSNADTDAAGTGERRSAAHEGLLRDGQDIGVDRVFSIDAAAADDESAAEPVDEDKDEDDEDPDLAFIDRARADVAQQGEAEDEVGEVEDDAARVARRGPTPGPAID